MCCHELNRREFIGLTGGMAAGAGMLLVSGYAAATNTEWEPDLWDPERPFRVAGKPLAVQPVLMYHLPTRREMSSWKSWGGIQTEAAVAEETQRIARELAALSARADFPFEVKPVITVGSGDETAHAQNAESDVTVLYPATGSGDWIRACLSERGGIIFVRHRSGPVYYWYEALSTKYLQPDNASGAPATETPRLSVHDVVVDDPDELLWRLRALYGVRNLRGARVLALGGTWGKYAPEAPDVARDKYRIEIVEASYDDLAARIERTMANPKRVALAERWTKEYLRLPHTKLETDRQFIVNGFLLYGILKEMIQGAAAQAFTIRDCMSTVLPMTKTTACLTLSLLNDEGLLSFCESDFVVIPAGILLHYIAGKPVFMHNSTFPHNGMVTCAHCTGPRRMNAKRYEPARVLTHYESEYGAAPKVEIPEGQEVTFVDPEYASGRWVGIKGVVESNPFYEICRSQQDVRIQGNWRKLLNEVRDSHWMMVYGDYLREVGYAAPRIGVTWDDISTT